jgi:hypothetical protein
MEKIGDIILQVKGRHYYRVYLSVEYVGSE